MNQKYRGMVSYDGLNKKGCMGTEDFKDKLRLTLDDCILTQKTSKKKFEDQSGQWTSTIQCRVKGMLMNPWVLYCVPKTTSTTEKN